MYWSLVFAVTQAQAQAQQLLLHFLQGFTAQVAHLHHLFLIALDQFIHGIDAGPLEAVVRADGKIQFLNAASGGMGVLRSTCPWAVQYWPLRVT